MKNKGITLIALIITIIVLLILAGVSIALVIGDNGIINKATKAKSQTVIGDVKETAELIKGEYVTENEGKSPSSRYIIESLIEKNKITQSQVLDYGDSSGEGLIVVEGEEITIKGSIVDLPFFELSSRYYDTSYCFEEGMTWREWINSKYNVSRYEKLEIVTFTIGPNSEDWLIETYSDFGFRVVSQDINSFLDQEINEDIYFAPEMISLPDDFYTELSQFEGQKWEDVWDETSFITFREKWNLYLIDNGIVGIDLGAFQNSLYRHTGSQSLPTVSKDEIIIMSNDYFLFTVGGTD